MKTALYYPHVKMGESLVKNALFLWDRVEYIAPNDYFEPRYEDEGLSNAVKLLTVRHIPNEAEQTEANNAIVDLLETGLPDWFFVKDLPEHMRYSFFPRKFCSDTWKLLEEANLAEQVGDGYETSEPFGLSMMSLMADTCAGSERRLITDEIVSYSALDRYLTTIGGGELGQFDNESERLVTISLKTMNLQDVSLERLVELRQKESRANGAHLRGLRHNYLERIEEYANKIASTENERDAEELERIFEQEMQDDFELLKDELKDEAKKVFFSKEMATAAIAIAGSFLEPVVGLGIAGGALCKKKVDYRTARNKTLQGHPMSWLYSTKKVTLY